MAKRRRNEQKYTKPKLRQKIKEQIQSSDQGGAPGQWSARKSQRLAQEYKKQGGGYRQPKSEQDEAAQSLEEWTEQDWQTAQGTARARQGKTTRRYLPKQAWKQLADQEKQATERKKQRASRRGQQYVANPPPASRARRKAAKQSAEQVHSSQKTLYQQAKELKIPGRSKMNKRQLMRAIAKAH